MAWSSPFRASKHLGDAPAIIVLTARYFAALLVIYCLFVGLLFVVQRHMVFMPDRLGSDIPPEAVAAGMEPATVRTSDRLELTGWYQPPTQDEKPFIVFFHGNAGSLRGRAYNAKAFVERGYGFLFAEYRGYNGNPGTPSEQAVYRDGDAYVAWLEHQGIPERRIVLMGESLGTGVAVQMARRHPDAAAVMLESPYTSLVDVARERYWFVPVGWLMRDPFRSIDLIRMLKMPLLVIHGRRDQIVPYSQGKTLFEAVTAPKRMVSYTDAGHLDLYQHDAPRAMLDFLSDHGL